MIRDDNENQLTLIEELTAHFYEWEGRGRGWQIWNEPVELEPPFIPFFHSYGRESVVDDGRTPTYLSTLADKIKNAFNKTSGELSESSESSEPEEVLPAVFSDDSEVKELSITIPSSAEIPREYADHFLLSLSACRLPVSFEILGTKDEVIIQFACREIDLPQIEQQIRSFFPEMVIKERIKVSDKLRAENQHTMIVDCGLSEEFMRPLQTFKNFDPDPLTSIFGTLGSLKNEEVSMVQVIFQSVNAPWASNIMHAVRNYDGSCFFFDAPEMLDLSEEKVKRPLFAVVLRLIGKSSSGERAKEIVRNLYSGLHAFSNPLSNELIPLTNNEYGDDVHLEDVILRQSHRSGMLLNSDELLGLIHFPSSSLQSSKLNRDSRKTHPLPAIAVGHTFVIGNNIHHNVSNEVSLST